MEHTLHRFTKKVGGNAWRICLAFTVFVALIASLAIMGLTSPRAATADATSVDIVVSGSTEWQYRDDNQQPADGWRTSATVTDDAWKSASGSFGAKRGKLSKLSGSFLPQNLLTQYIDGTKTDIPVYYFRVPFDVADPAVITGIEGSVVYDDAVTIYVNGVRIAGGDDDAFDQYGYGGSNADAPQEISFKFSDIASLKLQPEGNVVAAELHNGRAGSSDIYFDLKKLTLTTGAAEEDIKGVELAIGSTETSRNFNWLGTTSQKSFVELAPKPDTYHTGDAFPTENVSKVSANSAGAQRDGYHAFKATVPNIQAGTTYLYRVGNDEKWSEPAEFTTKDQSLGAEFNFLLAGDPQIGASGDTDSDTNGWTHTLDLAAALSPNFLLSAGDQVNSGYRDAEFDGYFAPTTTLTQSTIVGNHDERSVSYTDYNNMPNVSALGRSRAGEQTGDYWFTYNGVLFLNINSNNTTTSEHKQFLQEAIAANPGATWKIVSFHHSTFSLANHYTDGDIIQRRAELPPIFTELGIDVVLMGHDHYFTRTYLMDGITPVVPEGHDVQKGEEAPTEVINPKRGQVLYLTANSASGSKYYHLNRTLSPDALPSYVATQDQSSRPSITNVTVSNDALTLDTYYANGDALEKMDSFTIRRVADPTIALPGENGAVSVEVGQPFDPMNGVTATDALGADLTNSVTHVVKDANGSEVSAVDTSAEGTFSVEYTVEDAYGSSATATLTVNVVKPVTPDNPDKPNPDKPDQPNPDNPDNQNGNTVTPPPHNQSVNVNIHHKDHVRGTTVKTRLPQTSDQFAPVVPVALGLIATALIVVGIVVQRRRG